MKRILTLCFVLFLIPFVSLAAEKPVWVTAEGEALQGELDTLKEIKARARRDAQNKAVEMAVGTFIKSHTLVSNSQVAEDLIYAAVRGKITKEKTITADWDAQNRHLYKITIKALVEPVYPEKGGGLFAKLHLSKTDLKEGDEVKIFYSVSEDAYVYIFSIAADGSVTLLLPNANMPDNHTRAGRAYQFPPADNRIQLKAMFLPDYKGAFAEERIKIVATRKKEPLLPLGFKEGVFHVYDEKSTGMIGDLIRRLNQMDLADWAEAAAVYRLKK
ncbi:MAG: hypothetical protein CVU71_16145 [Deltaproteobacteria bacterium HGW-Deltaproteobacteria-6]|jgi:hypothetical protein|nr:MAG: hypothetical protein CVU71_16145 [Deltaproteobacteria bacterium HGW-Deltaproteobacteria-6]